MTLAAASAHLGTNLLGSALGEQPHLDWRQRQLRRPGEAEKVGDDLPERLGLVTDTLHVRTIVSWQALRDSISRP